MLGFAPSTGSTALPERDLHPHCFEKRVSRQSRINMSFEARLLSSFLPPGRSAVPSANGRYEGPMTPWARWSARLLRAAREEVAQVYPRELLGQALARALPQLTFNRTRTMVLRAAGLRIGERSLFMGPLRLTGECNRCELLSVGEDCIITGPLHI